MTRMNFGTLQGLAFGVTATLALPIALSGCSLDSEPLDDELELRNENGNRRGKAKLTLGLDNQIASELAIREPSMCDGEATTTVKWNRNAGWVKVKAKFKGLPYRPSFDFGDYLGNPGTATDPMPDSVEDGVWQIWLIGRWGTASFDVYWDASSGTFLGNEFDYPDGPPDDSVVATVPAFQLVCTDTFEANPNNLKANVKFTFDYHQILDADGTGGTYSTVVPQNLYDPDSLSLHAVIGGLPPELAMDWDDVLDDVESGDGTFAIYTSLEPDPKPGYLASRDNAMIGWAGVLNNENGDYLVQHEPPSECGTYQLDNYFSFLPSPE